MTVKENIDVAGLPSCIGHIDMQDPKPDNEPLVQRLLDAGAIIFGKTNVPVDVADWQSYNTVYGRTNNPWNLALSPGGSSGGSAAAVAVGLTPLEVGGDIGGSIRIPAHFCGVYGHKATYGIIPKGSVAGSGVPQDLAVKGPICRSPEDLALVMDVISGTGVVGHMPSSCLALHLPRPTKTSLRQYRFAIWADDPVCPVDEETKAAVQMVVQALRRAGVSVSEFARPKFKSDEMLRLYLTLLGATMSWDARDHLRRMHEDLAAKYGPLPTSEGTAAAEAEAKESFEEVAARAAVPDFRRWHRANDRRHQLRHEWRSFFEQVRISLEYFNLAVIVILSAVPM